MAMFDPAYAPYLDTPERRKTLPPREILRVILSLPMERKTAVDVGAGTGYLTVPLSWIFGKVYAIEANPKMAELLMENLKRKGITNVEVILSEKPPELKERPNLVAFSLSLHEVENPIDYLMWSSMADFVLIIEWLPGSKGGPREWRKIPPDWFKEVPGFDVFLRREYWPYYLLVLRPSGG